ncbi:hypothetical protein CWI38_0345p0030 [Hamiltosporidium tvaerminnensis]|uniref:Reverse transcriptase n=1 Tax=Hamiltosporidium tvaerminnensis TaxID=1176355 RepID=A0A4Q9LYB6_9MICR|nr:hypothetical protein CWI38_0345p0030 [Hamiltosporidium tvaerminnensis]
MGRKKVDSENIKNEKVKAVNISEIGLKRIKTCFCNLITISERLSPQPIILNKTNLPSSNPLQATLLCLVETIPSVFLPANTIKNLNTSGIPEGNRVIVLDSIRDSVQKRFERMHRNGWSEILRYYNEKFARTVDIDVEIRQEENKQRSRIARCLAEPCSLTDNTFYMNPRKKFLCKIKELSEKGIGDLESIKNKTTKLLLSKDLLEKARKQEKLSTSETKSLRKIMREFNLDLSKINDLSEALVKKNEALNVYEKKITMYESRRKFRKENRMFELFRTTFPSLEEFIDIINWLPNLNVAVFNSIDNFYFEKLTTLHRYLYDIVKVISDWYYCGLIYLIPKGTPKTGANYKPITCMSNLYKLTTKSVARIVQIEMERRELISGIVSVTIVVLLCMDPLSRKLNEKYTKVTIKIDAEFPATNHLSFIDDLKLLSKEQQTLEEMTEEVLNFMNNVELEINKERSGTNDPCCKDTATLLEGIGVYKYLEIIEDSREIPKAIEKLCRTRLIARNLFQAINQHAISFLNYYIGLDDAVRVVLVKNKIHLRLGYKERLLYLPRKKLGRGKHSFEFKSEHMLLKLLDFLEKHKDTSTRRAAILKVENNNKTYLSLIKNFLKIKYGLEEVVAKKKLEEAQLANKYNEIKNRKLHSKLYSARNNELVSVNDSSRWLKKGSVKLRDEAVFCYIQNRNVFRGAEGMCQHCNQSRKTVDHLATRFQEILDNEYAQIRVDTRIKTFGITTQGSLQKVETEKLRKYDLLANELGLILITYVTRLQLPMNVEAYIKSIVLKNTVETIFLIDEEDFSLDQMPKRAYLSVILGAVMHKQPTHP